MAIFNSPIDGTPLFYRHYIPSSSPHRPASKLSRQPLTLVFLHGWPMSSRMFDQLIIPVVETHRFPVIAPDRRGFGNSHWSTPSTGEVTYDTFVNDAVALLEHALFGNSPDPDHQAPFVIVAASMGTAESLLTLAASPRLKANCRGLVWIGPNMPYPVRCDACPGASDPAVWDTLVQGFRGADGKDFIAQVLPGVFRVDLPGNEVGARTLQFLERLVGQADPMAVERTAVILQKPMGEELRRLAKAGEADERERVPVLIMHGDSDTGMPLETSAAVIRELVPWSELRVYEKAGHGLYLTHSQQVLDDLLAFLNPIATAQQE